MPSPNTKPHLLSQSYLKGFTEGESKKSPLYVYNLKNARWHTTRPARLGGWYPPPRFDTVQSTDPGLADGLERLRRDSDRVIQTIGQSRTLPEGAARDPLLNLVALYLAAHPRLGDRQVDLRGPVEQAALDLMIYMPTNPYEPGQGAVSEPEDLYESIQPWFHHDAFDGEVAESNYLPEAFITLEAILTTLKARNWFLIDARKREADFVAGDWPVAVSWQGAGDVPERCRDYPGLALQGTDVSMPLRRDIVLVGRFEGLPKKAVKPEPHLIAAINTRTAASAQQCLFAPRQRVSMLE